MPNVSNGIVPSFLEAQPAPVLTEVRVTNRTLSVWKGRIKIANVLGWQDNPRIMVHVAKFKATHGRAPNQADIFNFMKSDKEIELKRLKKDIEDNGVRQEIWLSKDCHLLDGNRRYFAARYALEELEDNDPRRSLVATLPAIVLVDAGSDDDNKERERLVVVQQNFAEDLKRPWTDIIKAQLVWNDHQNFSYSREELAKRYDWKKSDVDTALRTYGYIEEFLAYATQPKDDEEPERGGLGIDEDTAKDIADKHYQKFNEAQKSFKTQLNTMPDFKRVFFQLISEEKFKTWQEVRYAYEAYNDPAIRRVLLSNEPDAAKRARIKVESKQREIENSVSHEQQIEEFTAFLAKLEVDEVLKIPQEKVQALKEKVQAVFGTRRSQSE